MNTHKYEHPLFPVVNYMLLTLFAALALIPFLIVLSGSFMNEKEIILHGIRLIPEHYTFNAYQYIFRQNTGLFRSYGVTIFVTVVGTAVSVLVTGALSYVISVKQVKLRDALSFFVYFTMLFNGGMIPWYILCVKYLQMKNSIWALILPMLVNPFYIFLMRSYFKGIPEALRESGIIDGAGEMRVFLRIILPISAPILATISLFYMLAYWNDFYLALFFVDKAELIPLQYHLYRILSTLNYIASATTGEGSAVAQNIILPSESVRLATTILTIGPIIFVYPFIQKHFIKGITIGAVKG